MISKVGLLEGGYLVSMLDLIEDLRITYCFENLECRRRKVMLGLRSFATQESGDKCKDILPLLQVLVTKICILFGKRL